MNYQECQKYLAGLGQELHGRKFGLEAITRILVELGYPHQRYSTAVVAGTNGKGSTCAMLASILQAANYRTGLYTSPHLVRVNERLRVNGREASDEEFATAFSAVAAVVDRMLAQGRMESPPSYFEVLTATAFQHFSNVQAEFVVLEVGLGGRLDATNVTDPRVVVVTNVELDHVEYLGNTLAAIAGEKAGVFKRHRPIISGVEDPSARAVIRARAQEFQAELLEIGTIGEFSNVHASEGRYTFDLTVGREHFARLRSPLSGRFQIMNTAAAVLAASRLVQEGFEIPRRHIVEGLRETVWRGRLEQLLPQPLVLLDGAHNPAAAQALATFVREELAGRRLRLVYASMRDKAIREIAAILFPLAAEVYLTAPDHPRAARPEEILAAVAARPSPVQLEPTPARALEKACAASAGTDVVLVAGSLYLVGAIKQAQRERTLQLPGLSGAPR